MPTILASTTYSMKLYKAMDNVGSNHALDQSKYAILEDTMKLCEKLKRKGKSHRSVLDRNRGDVDWIESSIPRVPRVINTNDKSGNGTKVKEELIGFLLEKMNNM